MKHVVLALLLYLIPLPTLAGDRDVCEDFVYKLIENLETFNYKSPIKSIDVSKISDVTLVTSASSAYKVEVKFDISSQDIGVYLVSATKEFPGIPCVMTNIQYLGNQIPASEIGK